MLRHWFYLLRATAWLLWTYGQAIFVYQTSLSHWLKRIAGQQWNLQERRRLRHYYNGTTYLSAIFCCLRGYSLDIGERRAFAQLSALAGFFDDLVDARYQPDALERWYNDPEAYGQAADERGLAIRFLLNIRTNLSEQQRQLFNTFMLRVFNLEIAGKQINSTSTLSSLALTTAEKGGYSVLLFRSVLQNGLSSAEEEALYQFGHLIQLSDDIFDVWFDLQADVDTVATRLIQKQQIQELAQCFERQEENTRHAFRKLPLSDYTSVRIETTLRVLHYLTAITRVCLKHYAALALEGPLPLQDRGRMVIDMARRRNQLHAAYALLRPE